MRADVALIPLRFDKRGLHQSSLMKAAPFYDARFAPVDAGLSHQISLFAGEAGGRLDAVLRDAFNGELKQLYNFMDDLPGLEGAVTPLLPAEIVKRAFGNTSFDAGRDCPFTCSFCTTGQRTLSP